MFTAFQSVLLKRLPVQASDHVVELSGAATGAATEVPITPSQLHRSGAAYVPAQRATRIDPSEDRHGFARESRSREP